MVGKPDSALEESMSLWFHNLSPKVRCAPPAAYAPLARPASVATKTPAARKNRGQYGMLVDEGDEFVTSHRRSPSAGTDIQHPRH
jgi:hypothetical protein